MHGSPLRRVPGTDDLVIYPFEAGGAIGYGTCSVTRIPDGSFDVTVPSFLWDCGALPFVKLPDALGMEVRRVYVRGVIGKEAPVYDRGVWLGPMNGLT